MGLICSSWELPVHESGGPGTDPSRRRSRIRCRLRELSMTGSNEKGPGRTDPGLISLIENPNWFRSCARLRSSVRDRTRTPDGTNHRRGDAATPAIASRGSGDNSTGPAMRRGSPCSCRACCGVSFLDQGENQKRPRRCSWARFAAISARMPKGATARRPPARRCLRVRHDGESPRCCRAHNDSARASADGSASGRVPGAVCVIPCR